MSEHYRAQRIVHLLASQAPSGIRGHVGENQREDAIRSVSLLVNSSHESDVNPMCDLPVTLFCLERYALQCSLENCYCHLSNRVSLRNTCQQRFMSVNYQTGSLYPPYHSVFGFSLRLAVAVSLHSSVGRIHATLGAGTDPATRRPHSATASGFVGLPALMPSLADCRAYQGDCRTAF